MAESVARRVLLVAPPQSYRIGPYLHAAQQLGVEVLVASDGAHSLVPEIAGGLRVPFDDVPAAVEIIQRAAQAQPFLAVIGTEDAAVELASRAAQALGLRHNSPRSAAISRRKDRARRCLQEAGMPVPGYRLIDLHRPLAPQLDELTYPCVIKPLALSGSRGVIRVDDAAALQAACARISALLRDVSDPDESRYVLVEDYLPGTEVAVEGMLHRGAFEPLVLFDKPDALEGPFFEETYYVTPSRLSGRVQRRILERVAQACGAYGLMEGPVHAELRVHQGEAWVLEVAARTIGGECARLVELATGQALEALVIARALDQPLPPAALSGGAGVLMIPIPRAGVLRRVEGVLAARQVPYVEDVVIAVREGHELVPLPEGASYLGFIFACAPTAAAAEAALRQAHGLLNVVVAPVWRLTPGKERLVGQR